MTSLVRLARGALAVGALVGLAGAQQPGEFEVAPRIVDWDAARAELVDPGLELPWPSPDDVRALRGRLERLNGLRFDVGDDDACCASLGDLVAACASLRTRPRALELLLARIASRRPDVWSEFGDVLPRLVRDAGLRSTTWDPDEARFDDGILFGDALTFGVAPMPGWREVEGSRSVQQAATLIYADLSAIEKAENDYRAYRDHVGATYISIFPVPGSHLRGLRDDRPFAALRVSFVSDLPFPFTTYACDLQVLKHLDEAGHLVTSTWSASPDFFWIGGSNLYLPVRDARGQFVAMLAVRLFGFDLRGVPDGDANRRAGLRSVLGNLKRAAEAEFARRRADVPLQQESVIPDVPLIGIR